MLIKSLILILFSFPAFALVEFPAGKCELEGLLTQENQHWFLSVNPKTNSEIRLRLLNFSTKEKEPPQFIKVQVQFKKSMNSFVGEVEFLKTIKELNPYREPIRYTSRNIKEACPSAK